MTGDDNELVMMTVNIRLRKILQSKNSRLKYNLDMLKDSSILDVFQAKIGEKFISMVLLNDS